MFSIKWTVRFSIKYIMQVLVSTHNKLHKRNTKFESVLITELQLSAFGDYNLVPE